MRGGGGVEERWRLGLGRGRGDDGGEEEMEGEGWGGGNDEEGDEVDATEGADTRAAGTTGCYEDGEDGYAAEEV